MNNITSNHTKMKSGLVPPAIAFLILSTFITSCYKEPLEVFDCQTETLIDINDMVVLNFEQDISPILMEHCNQCHNRFDEYSYVKKFVDNDKLLGSIQHKKGYSKMPKNADKLDDSLIIKISCWIQNGAPEK